MKVGVDTNVLVRFLVADDDSQNKRARRFISERSATDPAYVSFVVVAELVWVLRRGYKVSEADIANSLTHMLRSEAFEFEDQAFLMTLFHDDSTSGADVADHLIARLAMRSGCERTVTCDERAERAIPSMELVD